MRDFTHVAVQEFLEAVVEYRVKLEGRGTLLEHRGKRIPGNLPAAGNESTQHAARSTHSTHSPAHSTAAGKPNGISQSGAAKRSCGRAQARATPAAC